MVSFVQNIGKLTLISLANIGQVVIFGYKIFYWTFKKPFFSKQFFIQIMSINKTNNLMGGISLSNFKSEAYKSVTIGYWMGEEYAGKGYMKDSLKIICDYCFIDLGLNRIEAACLPKNLKSKKVLLNVGFKVEGYAKKYLNINGKLEDHLLLAKIKKYI